jgi:23S rRNA (cytidine2498-2'-O)-methyltransferase
MNRGRQGAKPQRDARHGTGKRGRRGPKVPRGRAQPAPDQSTTPRRRDDHRGAFARKPAPARAHPQRGPAQSGRRPQQQAEAPLAEVDPTVLAACLADTRPVRVGEWLWTTRAGAERDVIEELLAGGCLERNRPRRLMAALVASGSAPRQPAARSGSAAPDPNARLELTFARQGFRVAALAKGTTPGEIAAQLAPAITAQLEGSSRHALQVFVPDSDAGNAWSAEAEALRKALDDALGLQPTAAEDEHSEALAPSRRVEAAELRRHGGLLVQVCLLGPAEAALGSISADRALSLWPGGRARMRLGGDFPSRAARKLAEAFAWLGIAPGSGETCVDLGAAPGGWSWLLLEHKARVIAVDPAKMNADLMANPRLRHIQASAFDYEPSEPVDWLFCDMAWRPLEVAQLLARWARRRDTRLLVANIKLPMKRKHALLERVRALLAGGGFGNIRTRQLYHDRDEITLTAHLR